MGVSFPENSEGLCLLVHDEEGNAEHRVVKFVVKVKNTGIPFFSSLLSGCAIHDSCFFLFGNWCFK